MFYRRDVPECTELRGTSVPSLRMTLAHSFKDKQDRPGDVNAGRPSIMLMAADIRHTTRTLARGQGPNAILK